MIVAIFNGVRRDGIWHVRPSETIVAVFGGVRLDYTRAILPPGSVGLKVFTFFGGVNIRVPAGWAITQEGVGIFGGFAVNRRRDISPDPHEARPFFIGGLTVFGGVSVDEV